jgi:hypothetical protein
VFELAGDPATWIWVHTCPKPRCECRSALVLATSHGREVLLERGAAVHDAWLAGSGYMQVAGGLRDLEHFLIDIDTVEAYWTDGNLVAWNDVCTGLRQDIYVLGRRHYEATELYCPVPECECGEVVIDFEALSPRGAPDPGLIVVERSGAVKLDAGKRAHDRLEQLWAAFRKRHPRYSARFERRDAMMKEIGTQFVTPTQVPPAARTRVGRNEPCPCGSGRKFKKCCGAS